MVDFGYRVKTLRKRAGLTQKQLAERIWVSKAAISNYEMGERKPSLEIIVKLAKVFHVSTDYLLGIAESNKIINLDDFTDEEFWAVQHLIEVLRKDRDNADD